MHLLEAGVNLFYIKDFLGHEDISTTEVYDGAYLQQMREKEGSRLVCNLYRFLRDLGMTDLEIEGFLNKEVNC